VAWFVYRLSPHLAGGTENNHEERHLWLSTVWNLNQRTRIAGSRAADWSVTVGEVGVKTWPIIIKFLLYSPQSRMITLYTTSFSTQNLTFFSHNVRTCFQYFLQYTGITVVSKFVNLDVRDFDRSWSDFLAFPYAPVIAENTLSLLKLRLSVRKTYCFCESKGGVRVRYFNIFYGSKNVCILLRINTVFLVSWGYGVLLLHLKMSSDIRDCFTGLNREDGGSAIIA
jgi:hypothetical protein